jgi:hypothetical protein
MTLAPLLSLRAFIAVPKSFIFVLVTAGLSIA